MDEAVCVRVRERVGDRADHLHALEHGQTIAIDALPERRAIDPLHRVVERFALDVTMRDVAHDAWVCELRQQRTFACEPLDVDNLVRGQHLDRDWHAALAIVGTKHRPHAAGSDLGVDVEPAVDRTRKHLIERNMGNDELGARAWMARRRRHRRPDKPD